jgi:D-glycero-D-manno-heptose 1,7-bisphosphate phosphatase
MGVCTLKKAFFLDRDGVINKGHSLNRPKDLKLYDGVPKAIKMLNDHGYDVFVVTNQGGVGLGYMKIEALDAIHAEMCNVIQSGGGTISDIRACTHKPKDGCECRKPKPGMILDLAEVHNVDKEHSFMVGDRDVDIQAGETAGLHTIYIGEEKDTAFDPKPDFVYPSLIAAVEGLAEDGII